ncbi:hypothetical protein DENSPDRAFT_835935 [Dentipellis sp. KUC8613]|nr:hypothetical protein DENSPDRAFT_835935 [Dentipellis sp. KUC8613]
MNDPTPPPDTLPPALADLHIAPPPDAPNPWEGPTLSAAATIVRPPSSAPAEQSAFAAPSESEQERDARRTSAPVDPAVLSTFDPLAGDAWADSEGHPPRPQTLPPPPPPKPDTAAAPAAPSTTQQASTTAAFPALTAFARSLALPSLPTRSISLKDKGKERERTHKERPRSMDTATLMQTPVMPGSFAEQQKEKGKQRASRLGEGMSAYDSEGDIAVEVDDVDDSERRGSPKRRSVDGTNGTVVEKEEKERKERKEKKRGKNEGSEKMSPPPAPPPFDFQKFLDQMKSKGAEPVARYLRSFLSNFSKRTFTVTDQVKLINDFLGFISQKMRTAEPWRNANEAEFDNAMEGMEKLVMNRLYDYTFTPATARLSPPRPITTDDLERDRILAQRISLFAWIEPRHLDLPVASAQEQAVGGFLMFAEQELVKINHYKAPRDKLICILNCCKVIFGLIRHLGKDESADTFLPILIFIVLKANPENLLSNVEFIQRFRNPTKLQSEAGYYLSSLMGAVSFIETMDHTSLSNISQEEFESNVETAISALSNSRTASPYSRSTSTSTSTSASPSPTPTPAPAPPNILRPPAQPIPVPVAAPLPNTSPHAGEEPAQPLALEFDARRLRDTLSKPLSAIGRIFSEALDGVDERFAQAQAAMQAAQQTSRPQTPQTGPGPEGMIQTPYKPRVRRSPGGSATSTSSFQFAPEEGTPTPMRLAVPQPPASPSAVQQAPWVQGHAPATAYPGAGSPLATSRAPTPGPGSVDFDIPGLQAEIDAAHERQAEAAMGTLVQIFPEVEREVVMLVLEAEGGDLGRSIEKLLEMGAGA